MVSREFVKRAHFGSTSITIEALVGCDNSPKENSARVTNRRGPVKSESIVE